MGTIFKHNGTWYQCTSLEKKLKRLKIREDEIERVMDCPNEELESWFVQLTKKHLQEKLEDATKMYYFKNEKGESITSIYNKVPEGYEETTYDDLLELWNKHAKELLT
jgi:hypothetical protein